MNYKRMKEICYNYDMSKYLNFFKKYTLYDDEYALFFLEKRKIFSRIQKCFKCKYRFFANYDLSYGKITDERFFVNIDDAVNYAWSMLLKYSVEKKDHYLTDIIAKEENKV